MLRQDLKIVWRELGKYKLQSLIRIVSMAIGFTAFILGGYWWYWETHFDCFHPCQERLFAIVTYGLIKNPEGGEAGLNQLHKDDATYFKEHFPEIEDWCFMGQTYYTPDNGKQRTMYSGLLVDSMFFQLFHHRFLDGGYRGIVPDSRTVILTRKMAVKFFGSVHCTGELIPLDEDRQGNEINYKVAGVIEDYPSNSELKFDLLEYGSNAYNSVRRAVTYVRLNKKADVEKVKQRIATHKSVAVDPYGIYMPGRWRFELCAPADVHMTCNPQLGNRFRNIRILVWGGILVLLSTLMNHLVLFVACRQKKEKEYITRVSLGSSGKMLVVKMYVELLFPLFIAFILALCLIELLFPLYGDYTAIQGEGMLQECVTRISRRELLEKALVSMLSCAVLFAGVAAVPVWFIQRGQRRKMANRGYAVVAPVLFRRSLIVAQIFIGTLFFVASLSMYKQLYFLKHTDLGIDLCQVLQLALGYDTAQSIEMEQLKGELKACPWIEELTMTSEPVLSAHGLYYGQRLGFVSVEGRDYDEVKSKDEMDYLFNIEEHFFDFFRIPFKAGKGISEENPDDYVVNETGARELGIPDLLQRPLVGMGSAKISGIAGDYHYAPLQYGIRKVFFYIDRGKHERGMQYRYWYIRHTPGCEDQVRQHIGTVMSKYDRGEVSKEKQLIRLQDQIDAFNRPEVVIFSLFCVLAALCILVSSFGVFFLVALSVEQRKKEIAIRKVNGATFAGILYLFLKEYLGLVGIGGTIAMILGYRLMLNWLETYANHTGLGIHLFVVVAVLITGIVFLAVAVQVYRAVGSDPARALKEGE